MLEVMLAIVNINDKQLNELLRLKRITNLPAVDDAIVERLGDLHNPSTGDDYEINLIKSSLNL